MKSSVQELRSAKGRLMAKYYMDKGVIEIRLKNEIIIINIPPGTDIQVLSGIAPSTK